MLITSVVADIDMVSTMSIDTRHRPRHRHRHDIDFFYKCLKSDTRHKTCACSARVFLKFKKMDNQKNNDKKMLINYDLCSYKNNTCIIFFSFELFSNKTETDVLYF